MSSILDMLGVEWICEQICEEKTLRAICTESGVPMTTLLAWINSNSERSARVNEARAHMQQVFEEKALEAISSAKNGFELQKARELAHHYRWRASKIAPRQYGDRVDHTSSDGSMTPKPTRIELVAPDDNSSS